MKQYFFFNVLRRTIVQYFDLFNDIKIARYASDGKTIDRYVKVPIKHSIKEKEYYWLNERKDDEMLPMITAYISAIDYATDRKVNSNFTLTSNCNLDDNEVQTFLHPCPYNLTFTMNIWSLYMVDMDQILEQILPFFCPHVFIRIYIPEIDSSFDAKVIFRSATPDVTHEMDDTQYRIVLYNLDFEVQTWMFKPVADIGVIKKIFGSYITDPSLFSKRISDTTSTFSSGASGGIEYELKATGVDDEGEKIIKYNLFEYKGSSSSSSSS